MKITVIIPTYNEAENLPKLVSALFSLPLPDLSLLVVDDNSPDGTGQLADGYKSTGRVDVLHRAGKLGLGTAYIAGFQHALQQGAEAIVQMDADFSHPIEKIVEMAEMLPVCDIVIGSRYVPGGSLDTRWPFWRKALSAFGNLYARTILGLKPHDVTGGFRMWKRETLAGMPLDSHPLERLCIPGRDVLCGHPAGLPVQRNPDLFCRPALGKIQDVLPHPAGSRPARLADQGAPQEPGEIIPLSSPGPGLT